MVDLLSSLLSYVFCFTNGKLSSQNGLNTEYAVCCMFSFLCSFCAWTASVLIGTYTAKCIIMAPVNKYW